MANETILLLTPGFSQVLTGEGHQKPFQRFLAVSIKPLKRFDSRALQDTQLKLGVNETSTFNSRQSYV